MGLKLFSIGKMAELTGLNPQTLRYYSNQGLISPEYIDEKTGYRYYTFNQLHYIDRIKYLRSLNIPLEDIKESLRHEDPGTLIQVLEKQLGILEQDIAELKKKQREVEWYAKYFRHATSPTTFSFPHLRYFPERYAFAIPYDPREDTAARETRFTYLRNSGPARALIYIRQYGYTVDLERFRQGELTLRQLYLFIEKIPAEVSQEIRPNLLTFPAGNYLCFMEHIRSPSWSFSQLFQKLQDIPQTQLILANEYEDNLVRYAECPYEVEMLISTDPLP